MKKEVANAFLNVFPSRAQNFKIATSGSMIVGLSTRGTLYWNWHRKYRVSTYLESHHNAQQLLECLLKLKVIDQQEYVDIRQVRRQRDRAAKIRYDQKTLNRLINQYNLDVVGIIE